MSYRQKIDAALKAINAVFSDTTVSQEEARDALLELSEEIDLLLESLT